MRCGRQSRDARGDIRICMSPGNHLARIVCGYRGREQYCPKWVRERRRGEMVPKVMTEWTAGTTNGRLENPPQ